MLDLEVCVSAATPHLEYGMDPKVKKELLVTNPRYCLLHVCGQYRSWVVQGSNVKTVIIGNNMISSAIWC